MTFDELKERIDGAINNVWFEYQTSLGITDGDADPLIVLEYDNAVETIARLIMENENRKR